MIASEHPEVIEGSQRLIAVDVLEPEEAGQDGSIDINVSASDEEDESGFGEAGVSTGVIEVVTKEVEEVHKAVKYSNLSSFVLTPPYLITQVF